MVHRIQLKKYEVWRVSNPESTGLKVISGNAWITFKNSPEDFVLRAGEKWPHLRGEALIEALSDLVLEFEQQSGQRELR